MSDDEDFYDDEFDEIWIEDVEPGIADDLALTSHFEAGYVDDPALEVEDYFSDWDEQSDDYFDDDPTAARKKKYSLSSGSATGNDARQVHAPKTDTGSFQSVVWKTSAHEDAGMQVHEPGHGDKVALLKNWREVFKNSQPSFNRSWRRKKKVMDYLQSDTVSLDDAMDESPVPGMDLKGDRDLDSSNSLQHETPELIPDRNPTPPSVFTSRIAPSLQDLPFQPKPDDVGLSDDASETAATSSSDQQQQPSTTSIDTEPSPSTKNRSPLTSVSASPNRRKRKASVSVDDGYDHTVEDKLQPRPKRAAARRSGEATDQTKPSSTGPTRRSTRNKKA
ncbi:hypothetical protein ASPZODRAFT_140670 [Penicilliopsis zonata CBS 506.65]|uniref:Uncharacterized protein n=1 Tax=Penicilliopsis zonata CBS 506.65 TaxID=1073090 RepID=A0A1L9SM66_9EURO|nr:hypothetical protein ASPZODRAFT_140670 [Penicilliopsis zonata CBS 506.65]OJJ48372.1 hypothetical protein ASPZODRAFT_140670 [Penicilliopsis zonata CBS 506.65]